MIHEDGTADYVDNEPDESSVVSDQDLNEVPAKEQAPDTDGNKDIESEFFNN